MKEFDLNTALPELMNAADPPEGAAVKNTTEATETRSKACSR